MCDVPSSQSCHTTVLVIFFSRGSDVPSRLPAIVAVKRYLRLSRSYLSRKVHFRGNSATVINLHP